MADMKILSDCCILMHECEQINGAVPFIALPGARCAGTPPADPLQLYPLCVDCDLLHQHGDRLLFAKLADYLAESSAAVVDRQTSLDLGYEAMRKMLERLSLGDPDVRVFLPHDIGIFRELEPLMNQMAAFIKEHISDSHEMAIGLCEHYETLLMLANGDLESRASTTSAVELIAKLGELINGQADTFLDVIRQLRKQEVELQSLNQRLQAIIDFLPDATFVIDDEHKVIAWNRAIEEMSGVNKESILGEGDYAYTIPFYGVRRPALIDLIGNEEEIPSYNYRYFKRFGHSIVAEADLPPLGEFGERQIWITASPLYDLEGKCVGAIESIRDITDYKKLERERELLKEQLHHVQKLDSIGQLAGGIAHEFNNILAAILGYAGIMQKRLAEDSANQAAVRNIINAAEKAASLTRGMLAFSRKQVVAMEPLPLNSFLSGMKDLLCRLSGENIQIDFEFDSQELIITADKGQMQQIVLNLFNNALDAMPEGGSLAITTARRFISGGERGTPAGIPPGSYVQLKLADTGSGIRSELLDKIFDPFFTTKEVGKGTGLGLSIVFGIVQQHEGFITVESVPGSGTTFVIWFPECSAVSQQQSSGEAVESGGVRCGRETILVGEDNDDVRPMIVELLQDRGYQVIEARDGKEVVELMAARGASVDLLLLDVIMPRMNGYEALSVVRESCPDVPCLFLSGYSEDILKHKAKISGSFEYLTKPILPSKLIAAVQAALDGQHHN